MDEERRSCIICSRGSYEAATETALVPCNVRKWLGSEFRVWRCGACRTIHSLKREDMVMFYKDYPYGRRSLDDVTRRIFDNYLRRLKGFGLARQSTVLDYGCGEGLLVEYLRERGYAASNGFDPHSSRYNDPEVLNRQYDVVISQDVIEHVEDPRQLMHDLSSLLRPGGIIIIGTPRADGIDLSRIKPYIYSLHQPYHIHILSEKVFLELALEQGLQLLKLFHRDSSDTLYPFVNWRFLRGYLGALDDTLDAGFDPPRVDVVASSPRLLFLGLFGGILPLGYEMIGVFRKLDAG